MWLTAWAYIESQQQRIVYVFKGWDSGQSNLERKGSGLLILIIPSGRNPLHGPAVADRISWSVLGYQCGALGLWCCFEYGSRFSQPGNRNYSYWGIGVLVDVRTVKKLGLAQ